MNDSTFIESGVPGWPATARRSERHPFGTGDIEQALSYECRISSALARAYAACARSFCDVCRGSRGLFPTEVAIRLPDLSRLEHSASVITEDIPGWPEAHAIDFDWRFTDATAESLARSASSAQRVLCVGAPTVFKKITEIGGDAHLIDRNPLLKSAFEPSIAAKIITADISSATMALGGFDAVIMDPPWYSNFYRAWVSKCLPALKLGGRIFLVLFPELVRETALAERNRILAEIACIGAVKVAEGALTYRTPAFERAVLAEAGLSYLSEWRVADLVEVTVTRPHRWTNYQQRPEPSWTRFSIAGQVIAVSDKAAAGTLSYRSPAGTSQPFRLSSVSARDRSRKDVTVWTSRNRVAVASGRRTLRRFFSSLTRGADVQIASSHAARTQKEVQLLLELSDDLCLGV